MKTVDTCHICGDMYEVGHEFCRECGTQKEPETVENPLPCPGSSWAGDMVNCPGKISGGKANIKFCKNYCDRYRKV